MNEKEEFAKIMNRMKTANVEKMFKWLLRTFVLVFVFAVFFGNCIFYVKPNEFAIKQINIGINPGVREKVYNTGF
ncbi:MAG: hypothetical protein KAJ14_14660, partial [Candidatus Omnitrophica bacterium]|nr:hypothetical protein [Candidatus Omnitrophota bacterium]